MTSVEFCFNGGLSLILRMSQVPRVGDHVKFFVGRGHFTEAKVKAVVWLIGEGLLDDQIDAVFIDLEWLDGLPSDELGERYGENDATPDIEIDSEEAKEGGR